MDTVGYMNVVFKLWTIISFIMGHRFLLTNAEEDQILTLESISNSDLEGTVDKLWKSTFDGLRHKFAMDECDVNIFHPSGVFSIISNTQAYEDCVVLCRLDRACRAVTFADNLMACYFFTHTISKSVQVLTDVETTYCTVEDVFNRKTPETHPRLDHGPPPVTCGLPYFPFENEEPMELQGKRKKRIIGGEPAPFYALPWMVQLVTNHMTFCGGSIIALNPAAVESCHVLTAAHCFLEFDDENDMMPQWIHGNQRVFAYAGRHDTRFTEAHEQRAVVVNVKYPHKFAVVNYKLSNDIAILRLNRCFRFNNYIRHICLPQTFGYPHQNHSSCFVAGWGTVNEEIADMYDVDEDPYVEDQYSPYLKRAPVKIAQFRPPSTIVTRHKFARNNGRMGRGDSGGPLFCRNNDGSYTIHGVFMDSAFQTTDSSMMTSSAGTGLKIKDKFFSVAYALEWIIDVLKAT